MPFETKFQLIPQRSNACTLISMKVLERLLLTREAELTSHILSITVLQAGNEYIKTLYDSTNLNTDLQGVDTQTALRYTERLSWANQDYITLSKPKRANQNQGLTEETILTLKQAFHARRDFAELNTWYEMCLAQILAENGLSYNFNLDETNEDQFVRNITVEGQEAPAQPVDLALFSTCANASSLLQSAQRTPPQTNDEAGHTLHILLEKLVDGSGLILTAGGHTTFVAKKEGAFWAYNPATGTLEKGNLNDATHSIYNKLMAPDTTELSIYLVSSRVTPRPAPPIQPEGAVKGLG